MQMGRERKRNGFGNFWNGNENRNYSGFCCDYDKNDLDQAHSSRSLINKVDVMSYSPENLFPISSLASAASSSASSSRTSSPTAGASYIEHHVSKFDTLAGIAIKYGVEVCICIFGLNFFPVIFNFPIIKYDHACQSFVILS